MSATSIAACRASACVPRFAARRRGSLALAALVLAAGPLDNAAGTGADSAPRGTVEWTRLITPNRLWDKHAHNDAQLLEFIAANTKFRVIDRRNATEPGNLDELCHYPFAFAHDIGALDDADARNVAEYMKRGGFVFIDYCANPNTNPNPAKFIDSQRRELLKYLPELRITPLPPDHEVFRSFFTMRMFPPQADGGWLKGAKTVPLLGLHLDGRMVGVIAANGFHCTWDNPTNQALATECMRMVTNIYVYAMTH